jgi:hypothetical protein
MSDDELMLYDAENTVNIIHDDTESHNLTQQASDSESDEETKLIINESIKFKIPLSEVLRKYYWPAKHKWYHTANTGLHNPHPLLDHDYKPVLCPNRFSNEQEETITFKSWVCSNDPNCTTLRHTPQINNTYDANDTPLCPYSKCVDKTLKYIKKVWLCGNPRKVGEKQTICTLIHDPIEYYKKNHIYQLVVKTFNRMYDIEKFDLIDYIHIFMALNSQQLKNLYRSFHIGHFCICGIACGQDGTPKVRKNKDGNLELEEHSIFQHGPIPPKKYFLKTTYPEYTNIYDKSVLIKTMMNEINTLIDTYGNSVVHMIISCFEQNLVLYNDLLDIRIVHKKKKIIIV